MRRAYQRLAMLPGPVVVGVVVIVIVMAAVMLIAARG